MRLSEAIRLGAMLRPQGFGAYFGAGATCARGAALESVGFDMTAINGRSIHLREADYWPWAYHDTPRCPVVGCPDSRDRITPALGTISHLNDDHRWTRERIAAWVATVEPVEIAPPVVAEILTSFDEVPTPSSPPRRDP